MKVLVLADESLSTPLVFATLEAFLNCEEMEEMFRSMKLEYFLMVAELEKPDGCWADKIGSVQWVEVKQ